MPDYYVSINNHTVNVYSLMWKEVCGTLNGVGGAGYQMVCTLYMSGKYSRRKYIKELIMLASVWVRL